MDTIRIDGRRGEGQMNPYKARVVAAMAERRPSLDHIEATLKYVKFPNKPRILGTSIKVEKSAKRDKTLTAVVYLAASTRSKPYGGMNTCPFASQGCAEACLGHTSGRLVMGSSQNAQVWKTLMFRYDRAMFVKILKADIARHAHRAAKKGLHCSVRLNGSSDLAWEHVAPELFREFPHVQFYDYSKSWDRMYAQRAPDFPKNYHLTFSRSENTLDEMVDQFVASGLNVAVVFRDLPAAIREGWRGHRVIDGDLSDYRAGDPEGVVVGLSVKGNVEDNTGFYV